MDYRTAYAALTFGTAEAAIRESLSSNLPGRTDGPADAYRHILLAGELSRRFGEDLAQLILNAHELTGNLGDQTPAANAMDQINNNLGIIIGREATSWEDVVTRARAQMSIPDSTIWLPSNQWTGNPKDLNGIRIPTGDPRLNWPPIWPNTGAPYPDSGYKPPAGNSRDGYGTQGDPFTGMPWPGVDQQSNQYFTAARNLIVRVDPLVLDLDGDGLELIGASGKILFDHNADGIKTGTGWVNAQDGLLVRDINGNGKIDTGAEGHQSLNRW